LLVPPLRDHREDIPGLADEFVRRYGKRFGNEEVRLSRALVEALCHACWPGNVRQLENAVARMVALGSASEIGLEAFADAPGLTATERCMEPASERTLPEQIEALERSVIARTMDAVAGNRSEAARRLGLSRGTLIEKLRKYGFASHATGLHAHGRSWSSVSTGST
jgi:two-component system response regulator AtoC